MKTFFGAVMAFVILMISGLSTIALANERGDTVDFIHSLYLGTVRYSFYNCTPSCGKEPSSTGIFGMSETLYWTRHTIHPGVQVGFIRTTAIHIHDPGEINDQLLYALAMARMPLKNKVEVYGGLGVGGQFTQIVLPNHQLSECNHRANIIKVGAEYPLTQRTGIGLEYLVAKNHHLFGEDEGMGGKEFEVKQKMQSFMATLALHF